MYQTAQENAVRPSWDPYEQHITLGMIINGSLQTVLCISVWQRQSGRKFSKKNALVILQKIVLTGHLLFLIALANAVRPSWDPSKQHTTLQTVQNGALLPELCVSVQICLISRKFASPSERADFVFRA